MLNRIILIGRLVADPELRYTGNGIPVTTLRIAVDRPYTNQQGEREVDFIDVVCWRKLADIVAHNLAKGRLIAVDGRLQIRYYEREGQRHQVAEVYADTVRFLDSRRDNSSGSAGGSRYSGSSSYSGPQGYSGGYSSGYSGYSGPSGYPGYPGPQGPPEPRKPVEDNQIPVPAPEPAEEDVFMPEVNDNEPDDVPF